MESCDVLVVGGGPAGSSFAWRLRGTGLDVMVIDKSQFPRDKVCAGWVTPAVFETLLIDVDDYGKNRVCQPITGFRTGMMGERTVLTEYGKPVSYGIRRSEFDHFLLQRCGARIGAGESLKTLSRHDDYWIANDHIKTPLIIGAGGHFCPVSSLTGLMVRKKEPAVIAQEIEFKMDNKQEKECHVRGDTPELYFCEDLRGYGWCFRKGDFLNIGLGREDNLRLPWHVGAFYSTLKEKKKIPLDTQTGFKGHAYLLYTGTSQNLVGDGVLLIGDAAGLAYPQSGEGIRPAIESGLMAADVVITAAGNYKKGHLQVYSDLLERRLGRHNPGSHLNLFPQKLKSRISSHLLGTKWFSRHIVLNRWFLHSHQQPLYI